MKAVTVRFSDDLHEALRKESYEYKRSINDIVTDAVAQYLESAHVDKEGKKTAS